MGRPLPHLDHVPDAVFVDAEEEPLLSGEAGIDGKGGLVVGQSFPVIKLTIKKKTTEKVIRVLSFIASVGAYHFENGLKVSETETLRCGAPEQLLNPFSLDAQL